MELLTSGPMKTTRRKFLGFMGLFAASTALVSRLMGKAVKKPTMVKMLTRDGHLVEVDMNRIPGNRKKATSDQVASWIWKNQKI